MQAWLKRISEENSDPVSIFKLLTDSQVTLQSRSIQKTIGQPATTWLCTPDSIRRILADIAIVSRLKTLTEGGHFIKPWRGEGLGTQELRAAATNVVIQKNIDA